MNASTLDGTVGAAASVRIMPAFLGPTVSEPDHDALRALVDRRLARRLGLTLPVAATIAALAGIGPDQGWRR